MNMPTEWYSRLGLGKEKIEIYKAGKFLLGFTVFFFGLSFLFGLIPLEVVELITAQVSLFLLNLLGVNGTIEIGEPVKMLLGEKVILISYLCTGALELIVLVSGIAASFGIGIRKRLLGVGAAIFFGFAFNQARIVATILAIFGFSLPIVELTHDLLFRIFLFVYIAGFYAVWFWWATRTKK
tara:strand:+ start:100 stop:645 length:546 start_codon:yes stop_codon:yes gene_type:complete